MCEHLMNNKLVKRLVMNDNDLSGSVMMEKADDLAPTSCQAFLKRVHGRVNHRKTIGKP